MREFWLAAASFIALTGAAQAQEERAPAGYVIAADLKGADRAAGTAVVRAGAELKPKIWMPLYAGDIVFVRDAASQIMLDMGDGGRIEVGGALTRYEAKGEIATDDDAWSVISKIGSILAGGGDTVVPENLASKGDGALIALSASNGPNMIVASRQPLILAWKGGTAPFRISLEIGKERRDLGEASERMFELQDVPSLAKGFDAIIEDSAGAAKRVPFRVRSSLPEAPASLAAAGPSAEFDAVLLAGWLAERPRGAWKLEALRRLHAHKATSQSAAQLYAALASLGY